MSNKVDNRVVEMRFDNQQFEKGVRTSVNSLNDLKKGLDLDKSVKGLSELQRVGGRFSLGNISSNVDLIASRFTALGIVATTVLQNITNSAFNAGKRLVSSLTLDPVTQGFSEYEIKMNSIQTILSATADKGVKLEDINKVLADLNEYSDKTIYNFAQMTENLSKFANAGVDINKAAIAIKGLSNVAAGAGTDPARMAAAIYQASQALNKGYFQVIDWSSLEQANMAGPKVQKTLKETAKSMGVFVDDSKPFRETLEKGWLTTDVFIAGMNRLAKDKSLLEAATNVTTFTKMLGTMRESVASGWAVTWENIIGDKNESTALFTTIANAFANLSGESADARNNMLAFWKANGGRQAVLQGIGNILVSIGNILEPIEKAFSKLFPPITGETLVLLSKGFKDITATFKIGEITIENLRKTFSGLFAAVDIVRQAFSSVIKIVGLVLKALSPVADGFFFVTGKIGEFLVYINKVITESQIFTKVVEKVGSVLEFLRQAILSVTVDSAVFTGIIGFIKEQLSNLVLATQRAVSAMKTIFSSLKNNTFEESINSSNMLKGSFDSLTEAGIRLKNSFIWIGEAFNKTIVPAFAKAGSVIKTVFGPSIEELINKIKQINLADIGAVLAGSGIFVIARSLKQVFGSIQEVTGGINDVIGGITGTLEAFQTKLKADALLKIAVAIGVLAVSILALSMIKEEDLTSALVVLSALFAGLTTSLVILQKAQFMMTGISGALISLGIAMLLLTVSLKKLSDIDHDKMLQGVQGLSALLMMLALFIKVTASTGGIQASMAGMIGLSLGILLMSAALERFGDIDPSKIQQGITGIAASLMSLALFIKMVGSPQNMISMGLGIIAIGAALYLFAGAVAIFGNMDTNTLTIGIIAMAASLMVMAISVRAMTGALSGAAAMLVMAVAINTLVPAIAILGNLELKTIGVALLALAGVFVVLGLAGLILKPLSPIILTLAASVGILGLGVYALGAGLVLFAAGVAAFAAGGSVMVAALTGILMGIINLIPIASQKLGEGFVSFLTAIKTSMPSIVSALKSIFESVIKVITEILPPYIDAFYKFIIMFLQKARDALPEIISLGMDIVKSLLKGVADNITDIVKLAMDIIIGFYKGIISKLPMLIKAGADMIIAILEGLGRELPRIIDAAFKLVIQFIRGLADALRENLPLLMDAVSEVAWAILDGLTLGLRGGLSAIGDIGKDLIQGLLNGIKKKLSDVVDVGANLGASLLASTKKALGIQSPSKFFKEIGNNIGLGLTNGIKETSKTAEAASTDMSKNVVKSSSNVVKQSNESAKKAFDKSVEWIDERKYYNELSLQQELAAWERVQARYIAGSEERKKADREVYRVKKEIMKADEEAAEKLYKDKFNNSTNWIDNEKYYDRLGLEDELAAWKRVQARYEAGTEERKRADREVYRLENEITKSLEDNTNKVMQVQEEANDRRKQLEEEYYTTTKEINDRLKNDIQSLTDEYERAVESRANSLYSAYSLFEDIKTKEDVSGKRDDLNRELADWERTQQKYAVGTEKRKQADKEVIRVKKELKELEGVTGQDLLKNLEDQVNMFDYWKNSIKVLSLRGVDEQLINELEAMGPKSVDEIEALNRLSKPELDRYVSLWKQKHALAKSQATEELEGMRIETLSKIETLKDDATRELEKYNNVWATKMLDLARDTSKQLGEIKTEWLAKIGTLRTDTEKEFVTLTDNITKTVNELDWSSLGSNIINGIMYGVKSKAESLAEETANAATKALESVKTVLGIKSPSKEFAKIGAYSIQGLVEGLKKYSKLAINAGGELGKATKDSLRSTFGNMANLLDVGFETTPTIRPVLDMTDVESGLASIFSKTQGITVAGTIARAASVSTNATKSDAGSVTNQTDNTKMTEINITNNYSVRSNEDIRKISSELRNTLDRYNYAKGVAVT